MKKYLFMMTALLVAFTSFALVACGGDDDSDDPVQPTVNKYEFTLQLKEGAQGDFDEFKAIYPDLKLTYKLPGKQEVTVPVGKDAIHDAIETTETGTIHIKYTGTLDESKLDEAKKYTFLPVMKYSIHEGHYTSGSADVLGFEGLPGNLIKERHSTFEYARTFKLTIPKE